ncbi:MAG: hypothetical protein WC372_08360 [Candidatus Neomarinimicrobiota bacterium]|jgi:hypothetical protein
MTTVLVIYLLGAVPRLHPVPAELRPYWRRIMCEPVYARWLYEHQDTRRPLGDFIEDNTQPVKDRQKAFQMLEKVKRRKSQ